jgi:DNA-binding IscR family transcriptional regulator
LQILRTLVHQGLLCSTRGVDGGYYLLRAPHQITLQDIVEAFDNSLGSDVPVFEGLTARTHDRLVSAFRNASRVARFELHKVTVADLLRDEEANPLVAVAVTLGQLPISSSASPI